MLPNHPINPSKKMKRILMVGLNCADWVLDLPQFPLEDSDQRCLSQSWVRGGNASNSSTVMAVLGKKVEFFGTLPDNHLKKFFMDDLESYGIKYSNCPVLQGDAGSSAVICSEETGSRTIIHHNGSLPELSYDHFKRLNLDEYNWVHFEGRNEVQTIKMLKHIQEYNNKNEVSSSAKKGRFDKPNYMMKKLPVSVEVEKRIETISELLPFADVALIGKDFAKLNGATNCIEAVKLFSKTLTKGTAIVCPWGEDGAACGLAGDPSDKIIKIDAYPTTNIVDSLGAGDTFNAAVIYALTKDISLVQSVRFGCKVAAEKLQIRGFKHIISENSSSRSEFINSWLEKL